MSPRSVDEQNKSLFELADAFEMSRAAEVPTYAPMSFARAERLLRGIRPDWSGGEVHGTLEAQIALVGAALDEAREKASAAEPHLCDLVRARAQAIRSSAVGYHAPAELTDAESHFFSAVSSAEAQDFVTADEQVAAAERGYFEATILSLERGPLERLACDVEYARDVVSGDVRSKALAELNELRDATRAARTGKMALSTVREMITSRAPRIRGLLYVGGQGTLGGEYLDPPVDAGGGWAPGTFEPPKAPSAIRISGRESDALTVVWKDSPSMFDSQVLLRSVGDGPFQFVAEFGASIIGWTTFEDTGLSADTQYSYRVRVQNEFGSDVTGYDAMAVGYTRSTRDIPVRRVQVYIRVADVPDAGTNDSIFARLQSPLFNYAPNGNSIWLDYAPRLVSTSPIRWEDDFARGSEFTYDVSLQYVRQLSDITILTLGKEGTDGVGIAEFALLVNETEVFRKYFGDTASTCPWLDDGDGATPMFSVSYAELRASSAWQSFAQAPPPDPVVFVMPNDEIVSRFEAIVGDAIHGTPARWRAALRPVRVTRATKAGEAFERLRVTLLFSGDVDVLPDPNVSLSFDLQVSITCNSPENTQATVNLTSDDIHASADFDLLVDLLLLAAAPAGEALLVFGMHIATEAAKSAWQPIVERLVLTTPGYCPTLQVDQDEDGDASIQLR